MAMNKPVRLSFIVALLVVALARRRAARVSV